MIWQIHEWKAEAGGPSYDSAEETWKMERLPKWKRAQLERVKDRHSRQLRLYAWDCLEQMLTGAGLTEGLDGLDIAEGMHGKPYCRSRQDLYFSISHCPLACACAAAEHPVGVDVERRFPFRETLARRVCGEQELREAALLTGSREAGLCLCWSLKEAILKMEGSGLSYGMENIDLTGQLRQSIPGRDREWRRSHAQVGLPGRVSAEWTQNERWTAAFCVTEPIL